MPNNMKILSEELKKYTKPTHLVDFTLGQDSSGNPIFASASETAETVDGWLTAGDNVVYRVQYAQNGYAYGSTTDHAIDAFIKFAAFISTDMFGPSGVYRLEARWNKTNEIWNAVPTIASVIPMENDYSPDAIAQPFSTSSTYAVGDVVMHDRLRYRCTTAISTAGAWNSSSWTLENVQTAIGNASNCLIVTGTYTDSPTDATLASFSHTYSQVESAINSGKDVIIVLSYSGQEHRTLSKLVFRFISVVGDYLIFESMADPYDEDEIYYKISWNSSYFNINSIERITGYSHNRLIYREVVYIDPSELPNLVIETTHDCLLNYIDNMGKVPVLLLNINNSAYIHLTGSFTIDDGNSSSIEFYGVVDTDLDGLGNAPWLIKVRLEPSETEGDPDQWTTETIKLSTNATLDVNATLNVSTMTISNADKTLAQALAAAQNGSKIRLVLNGLFSGWATVIDSTSIQFTVTIDANLGAGNHPYMVTGIWSNDGTDDVWTTIVRELSETKITMRIYED